MDGNAKRMAAKGSECVNSFFPFEPQLLYFRGILGFSTTIFEGYPEVLKCYIIEVSLGPQLLYFRGTFGFSSAILQEYPWVLKDYKNA
jgi:hypothetical protein